MPESDCDVESAVLRVIRRIAPDDERPTRPEAELVRDLGFQSLAVAELGFALIDLFDVTVTPETAFGLRNVSDVIELVWNRVRSGQGRQPSEVVLAEWEAGYVDDEELELQ